MRTVAPLFAIPVIVLLTGVACDQASPVLPTGPTAPAAPAIPQGEITIVSAQPESGATITAEECDGGWCVIDFRLVVDVLLDQAVAEPWVTVVFYNGSHVCAGSGYPTIFETLEPLRANTATRFTVSFLALSVPDGIACRLPQATTKMVVQLWGQRGFSPSALLTRELTHRYSFVVPF